ncbi:TPA: DNA topoisomerase [Burkholderia cepacia]
MSYQVGQKLTGGVARLRETETTPPKRFKDGTLISAMTNIDRFVPKENEADRKVLREAKGIGTERTRDAIIETLKQRKYMVRRKDGCFEPTNLGMEIIQRVPRTLSDPVTTAKWEMLLGLMEEGKVTRKQFDDLIRAEVAKLVDALKSVKFDLDRMGIKAAEDKPRPEVDETLPGHGETCEKCNKGRMVGKRLPSGKKVVGCSNFPSCKHSKWID